MSILPGLSALAPTQNKEAAKAYLRTLDPNASGFTFQLICDDKQRPHASVLNCSLDELWPKIEEVNTSTERIGVFVVVNETDLNGRRCENVKSVRAVFADADSTEQVLRCEDIIAKTGATPTMVVHSSPGKAHYYWKIDDIKCEQFTRFQEALARKLGTDVAVKDLPRVMRLPGTVHWKNATQPHQVKLELRDPHVASWKSAELEAKLGLVVDAPAASDHQTCPKDFPPTDRDRLRRLFGDDYLKANDDLSAGIETNTEEIRSAVAAIPPSAIASEPDWMKFARGLAHHAFIYAGQAEEFWEILDTASAAAPGYDRGDNWDRWTRYIHEAMERSNPITIATIFAMAKCHGWTGWVPLAVTCNFANQPGGLSSITAGLDVTFANLPHRQFLYGIDASRGEITVLAAPGGVGKSSLAIGIGVNVAVGGAFLQEKIWGKELTTLYVNGEDSGEEMKRRVWAYCIQHYISEAAIKRFQLLGADDWRTQKLSFLRTDTGNSVLDKDGLQILELLLQEIRPDLLVLDPLVSFCGGGNVNDNAVMALVMRALKQLATKFNCAILVVHHTRKGAEPGTAEAISGASSIVNLARRAIMVVPMVKQEAKVFGILPSEHRAYFKVVSAKSNLAPPSDDCPWYKLESITLPNPEPPTYPKGDNVQAVVRVSLSSLKQLSDPDDQKIKKAILDVVDRGKSVGAERVPYSPNLSGAHNARALIDDAMVAAQAATAPRPWHNADLNAAVTRAISDLKAEGALIDIEIKSGRFRRRCGLGVDWGKSPWKSKSNDVAPEGTRTDAAEQVPT